jgi:hypothetical protein
MRHQVKRNYLVRESVKLPVWVLGLFGRPPSLADALAPTVGTVKQIKKQQIQYDETNCGMLVVRPAGPRPSRPRYTRQGRGAPWSAAAAVDSVLSHNSRVFGLLHAATRKVLKWAVSLVQQYDV